MPANCVHRRLLTPIFLLLLSSTAPAQVQIYYLRHGESGQNAADFYKSSGIPTNEWPAYVGREDAFSPKGDAQVQAVVEPLQRFRFDLIAVSPKWRARHTILPYLEATRQTAEIWPELAETQNTDQLATDGGLRPAFFEGVKLITLPEAETPFLHFRDDGTGRAELGVSNRAEAVACANRVRDLVLERAGPAPFNVLLVGHGNAGRTLLRELLQQPGFKTNHLQNTCVWNATRLSNEVFQLGFYNLLPKDLPTP